MTSNDKLTRDQALLLQRYFDNECSDGDRERARRLLDSCEVAGTYLDALRTLHAAVQGAEQQAWQRADVASPDQLTDLVEDAPALQKLELEALAPILERYHDGEIDPTESAVVEALIEQREDVAEYLLELQRIGDGIRSVGEIDDDELDFDGFWEGIEEKIDEFENQETKPLPVAVGPYDPFQHQQILYRYHDGEATRQERQHVETWLEAGEPEVEATLEALAEVQTGVQAAVDHAVDQQDPDQLWDDISGQLDAIDAEHAADNVVSLQDRDDEPVATGWTKPMIAVAAAVALLTSGALLGPLLINGNSQPTETVVIFDSIESAPGSSVFVHSPAFADHQVDDGVHFHDTTIDNNGIEPAIQSEDDEADPTVLWVIEDDDDDDDDDERSPEEETEELPGPI